ncbi:MAG: D-aminoacyl-tRNA deacylase [Candidatus Thermoplasmatota archaeon]|nr:D-aminoacyl-tRNA deacylase [Candidatus Thermoplasmatota archaeon]
MTVLIISSTEDPAGTNIKKELLLQLDWEEIGTFFNNPVYKTIAIKNVIMLSINDRTIHHENIDLEIEKQLGIKPKQAIFISRHSSKTGQPTLTTHPIGNYGNAEFGGKTRTIIPCLPRLMTQLLREISKNAKKAELCHEVCFEVTHHGPFLSIPTIYAEVGSNEEEWKKSKPASIIAKSLVYLLNNYLYEQDLPKDIPVLVGIGGGHYAPRFTDIILGKNVAFGHMIPTYQIRAGNIDEAIIKQAIDKTPNAAGVYFHRKALKKSEITHYKKMCKENDIKVFSSKNS